MTHERRVRTCFHFRGIQNTCGAGVEEPPRVRRDSLPKSEQPQRKTLPMLFPCTSPEVSGLCDKWREKTPEEVAAEEAEMARTLQAFLGGLCPEAGCGQPLEQHDSGRTMVWACPKHGFVARGCRQIGDPS